MFKFGMGELLVVFFIVLLLFGAKRLPEIAKALGGSLKEFKKAGKDIKDAVNEVSNEVNEIKHI